jgi:hypothetical protein
MVRVSHIERALASLYLLVKRGKIIGRFALVIAA